MTSTPPSRLVSSFEANVLLVLQYILRRDPYERALKVIFTNSESPDCLSRDAMEVIQDYLRKGCIRILAGGNGWWHERYLKYRQVHEGRLWQRHSAEDLRLSFSHHTLRFLLWLTAENPADKKTRWLKIPLEELTGADWLFFYLAFSALVPTMARSALIHKPLFLHHPLCRLAYPEHFQEQDALAIRPDFIPWLTGSKAVLVEAFQMELCQRWLAVEDGKARITDWADMQVLGKAQEFILNAFLDALEKETRPDLARFLFVTLKALLPEQPRLELWTRSLEGMGHRLADRTQTHQAALVLPRQMSRLHRW
ncbi:MAG: hypothetical protein AB7P49_19835, partial [Bdellovibrionales bacterium]